ncbi:CotH kinase family protein, partial [Alistipes putredinis]|nr:CotH kinase family protein [Alistipes putredinis]
DSAVFKNTTDKDFKNIIDLMESLKTGENMENYLNVDEVLKYFAVNTFLVNLDSYSGGMYHNYYLYEKDGVSEILP